MMSYTIYTRSWVSVSCERFLIHTMRLEDRFDPPTFANMGADRWIKRNVERNGADAWASLTNIGVEMFLGWSPEFIVYSKSRRS